MDEGERRKRIEKIKGCKGKEKRKGRKRRKEEREARKKELERKTKRKKERKIQNRCIAPTLVAQLPVTTYRLRWAPQTRQTHCIHASRITFHIWAYHYTTFAVLFRPVVSMNY